MSSASFFRFLLPARRRVTFFAFNVRAPPSCRMPGLLLNFRAAMRASRCGSRLPHVMMIDFLIHLQPFCLWSS